MSKTAIIGAGLAGLMAACVFKDATIYEAGERVERHKALLRFRDQSVSTLTGIPFKAVKVYKNIFWMGTMWGHCDITMANLYSKKVAGAYLSRSIWDLDTVTRYVAPEDMYQQLVDRHLNRIKWNAPVQSSAISDAKESDIKIISTMPLPSMMTICGMPGVDVGFEKKAIRVDRFRLPKGTNVYQTVYFPDHAMRVFRASITGDMLIIESIKDESLSFVLAMSEQEEFDYVLKAMGMFESWIDIENLGTVDQAYGKIVELAKAQRESILYQLTREHGVFSLGRFATWRNILLDDVAKDIHVVEKLVAASSYGRELVLSKR